jgi:hypothetical protein
MFVGHSSKNTLVTVSGPSYGLRQNTGDLTKWPETNVDSRPRPLDQHALQEC